MKRILKDAWHIIEDVDPLIKFKDLEFRDIFMVDRVTGNQQLIFKRCIFKQPVVLTGFRNSLIRFERCIFKHKLNIWQCQTDELNLSLNICYGLVECYQVEAMVFRQVGTKY